MPRLHEINRNWVVDAITNPVIGSGGALDVHSTELQMVDDAYPLSVTGTSASLEVVAQIVQSHNFPGGSLSATLQPNEYVLKVYESNAGTLDPIASGTLSGVTLFVIEHGT